MDIVIDKQVFGKNLHLIVSGDSYSWKKEVSSPAWVVGNSKSGYPIELVCELFNIEPPSFLSEEQIKAFSILGIEKEIIPAVYVYQQDKFKTKLDDNIRRSSEAIQSLLESGYMETFHKEQEVLRGMSRGKIRYEDLLKFFKNKSNGKRIGDSVLNSFKPDSSGFMKKAVYSTVGTSTGRMTIDSGPQILTAPKEVRNFLVSKYPGGKIIQADLISLEPRTGRLLTGQHVDNDVYSSIGKNLFQNKLSRDQVKKSLLCAIYGAGTRTLRSLLPPDIKAEEVVESLKKYINFQEVVDSKKKELKENGKMKNHFGRPVTPSSDREAVIYNNWLQSTSVDIALLSFRKLLSKMSFADPVFLIHDAILLDVPAKYLKDAEEIICNGIEIDEIGIFPMTYSEF